MSIRVKNAIYTLIVLGLILAVWYYREQAGSAIQKQQITGETMGTTYSIIYFGDEDPNLKTEIDSILGLFNQSLNTWSGDSEISRFNTSSSLEFSLPYFLPVLEASTEIHALTNGAFDPTVMTLVNAWGFGPGTEEVPDSAMVDSILLFTGFEHIHYDNNSVSKDDERVQLDFSAIAKGYGVDIVSSYLNEKGIVNHFVEIGGEVRCVGKNKQSDKNWVIGITDPRSTIGNPRLIATVNISDWSMATSGNYFNYRIRKGKRYSHTINPLSGYPIEQEILSATIITEECMRADAIATAFMVLGHEKAIELTEATGSIESIILYSNEDGSINYYVSEGLQGKVNFLEGQ